MSSFPRPSNSMLRCVICDGRYGVLYRVYSIAYGSPSTSHRVWEAPKNTVPVAQRHPDSKTHELEDLRLFNESAWM